MRWIQNSARQGGGGLWGGGAGAAGQRGNPASLQSEEARHRHHHRMRSQRREVQWRKNWNTRHPFGRADSGGGADIEMVPISGNVFPRQVARGNVCARFESVPGRPLDEAPVLPCTDQFFGNLESCAWQVDRVGSSPVIIQPDYGPNNNSARGCGSQARGGCGRRVHFSRQCNLSQNSNGVAQSHRATPESWGAG